MTGQELLLLILCILLFGSILSGVPVAFALLGAPFAIAVIGSFFGIFDMAFVAAFPSRVFGLLTNPVLVSVPLFILMGALLEKSDIARSMTLTAGALFGNRPGGMAYAVVIVGALLAASTGVIAATIFMLGLIALPAMQRGNYSNRLSAGVICASGSLGQIIPPSILLIFLADQISSAYQTGRRNAGDWAADTVSVGDIFAAAVLPGLLLVGLYLVYVLIVSVVKPETCPPIKTIKIKGSSEGLNAKTVTLTLAIPLLLIALVLGSILSGIATPTESAALGASGALLLVAWNQPGNHPGIRWLYKLTFLSALMLLAMHSQGWLGDEIQFNAIGMLAMVLAGTLFTGVLTATIREFRSGYLLPVAKETGKLVSSILMIILGAFMLSLVFRGLGGDESVAEMLTSLPGERAGALVAVMAVIFLLGFVLEYIEIIFIVVPLACPPLFAAGIDPIWLAILISMNLQMSFLTPPFGYALFYLKSVAKHRLRTSEIYTSIIPIVAIQLIALLLVASFPPIATWLPGILYN